MFSGSSGPTTGRTPSPPRSPGLPELQLAFDGRGVSLAGWLALLAAAALAWLFTVQSAVGMPPGPGTTGRSFLGFLVLWTLMMAAMMLPSIAPVVSLYQRSL